MKEHKKEMIKTNRNKKWDAIEVAFLKENCSNLDLDTLRLKMNRSNSSIMAKMIRLNIKWFVVGHDEKNRGKNGRFLKGHYLTEEQEKRRGQSISKVLKGRKNSIESKIKASNTMKLKYKEGKIGLSGVALLSKEGYFCKGKNNPNFKYDIDNMTPPLCKCGCGQKTKFSYVRKGFNDFVYCHSSRGENNSSFNNWSSHEDYGKEFNNILKEQIRKRDCFTCQECNKPQINIKLSIHHIDYCKTNNSEYNLISLCIKCHRKTQDNREHWEKYFKMKMFIKELFNPKNIVAFKDKRLIAMETLK